MQTFLAVVADLWQFVLGESDVEVKKVITRPAGATALPPAPPATVALTPAQVQTALTSRGESLYVVADSAQLFHRPVLSFDGVVRTVPYGTGLTMLGYEGRFARVMDGDTTAFVLKDLCSVDRTDIYPTLLSGEIYTANHPDTKKIRTLLHDTFFATQLFLPLQAVEFVTYRLKLASRVIDWPAVRPRLAGTWQQLLKGRLGIQIGIQPKTGALLEFIKPDGTGFLAYTKAVHADESIVIEGVGRLIEGEYREEPLSKEEWQALQPVWISVT
jgi:hypothetical protein